MRRLDVAPLQAVRPEWPVKVFPGAGHLNCIFAPEFKQAINEWLDKQRGSPSTW
jgi:hypothetical protein